LDINCRADSGSRWDVAFSSFKECPHDDFTAVSPYRSLINLEPYLIALHPLRIPRAYEWAARYKPTPERPLLDMSQGVPGVPPPESLRSAIAKESASPDSFGYCRWDGEPALRGAVADEMRTVYGASDINDDDIALTAGCNLAFVAAAMSLASSGDEVILPVPWYVSVLETVSLL
jgi:aspartate/methionine/tyrosine aminotransferase